MKDLNESRITFTRRKLYDKVWSKPFTTLSKEYSYSANGLRKICKKHDIPTPNAGHWAKLRHGKSSPKKPLPKGENEKIEIDIRDKESKPLHSNSQLAKIKNELLNSDLNFEVSEKLTKPHLIVVKALDVLKKRKTSGYGQGRDIIYSKGDCLGTEVQNQNIPRAMRIWDTMIKLILKRGHKIEENQSPKFLIFEEKFTIRVREVLKRVKIADSSWDRTEMVSSGVMSIKIHNGYHSYNSLEWRDKKDKLLEDQLLNVLTKLEQMALREKQKRIERKAWRKKQEEEQAIKKEREEMVTKEISNFKNLFETASRWHKSQYLRNYIKEFETYAINTSSLNIEKRDWIEWAREKADWYDPFVEKEVDLLKDIDRESLKQKSNW